MLIMLFGITGAGKSYFTNEIIKKLPFNRVVSLTTREKRVGEVEGIDKYFVTKEELNNKINNDEIAHYFNYLGITYAYLKKDMLTNNNLVVEMHYTELKKLKETFPNMIAIYIMPANMEKAHVALKQRNLKPEVEEARLAEMTEEYELFTNNKNLLKQFDAVFYNNYDEESKEELLKLIESYIETKEEYSI